MIPLRGLAAGILFCAWAAIFGDVHAQGVETLRQEYQAAEQAGGPNAAQTLRAGLKLANAERDSGRLKEAEALYRQLLERAATNPDVKGEIPDIKTDLAILLRYLDRLEEAESVLGEAIAGKSAAGAGPSLASSHAALGAVLAERNRYAAAEQSYQRAIDIYRRAPDQQLNLAETRINYGRLLQLDGRLKDAEAVYREALDYLDRPGATENATLADALNNLGIVERRLERYGSADQTYRRAIGIYERSLGPDHRFVGIALNNLAKSLVKQGRYPQAEALYSRALDIFRRALGEEHTLTSNAKTNAAELYLETGKLAEAEALAQSALQTREKILGAEHYRVGESRKLLGDINARRGRSAEAERHLRAAADNLGRALGGKHALVAETQYALGRQMAERGEHGQAATLLQAAVNAQSETLGRQSIALAESQRALSASQQALGQADAARRNAKAAAEIGATLLGRVDHRQSQAAQTMRERIRALEIGYLDLIAGTASSVSELGLVEEMLNLAQYARASHLGAAIAEMAARLGTGNGSVAQAAAVWSEALSEWRQLDDFLLEAAAKPGGSRDAQSEQKIRARLAELDRTINGIEAQLAKDFPALLELVNPKPVSLANLQKLLQRDEALLIYLVGERRSYAWVVRQDRAAAHILPIGETDLAKRLTALRQELDPLQVDSIERLRQFDFDGAHFLYRTLLAPAEPLLEGVRHAMIVPDGVLSSVPFATFVVEIPKQRPAKLEEFAGIEWLGRRLALSVLPSPGALNTLRRIAPRSAAPKPFIGFGAPRLDGSPGGSRGLLKSGGFRAAPQFVDLRNLRSMPALPETAEELRAMAASLRGEAQYVFLAEDATETRVRTMDLSAFRVLAFSTHGLVAGDFAELSEPALVMTPPSSAQTQDDGLLTASEVATLRLNADWVILSACNTAAPDGRLNSEGLSGLAKAFFFAGSRALMVSHWSVNSRATMQLVNALFAEIARQPRMERAEALLRAQRHLMRRGDEPYFAHPMFWAAFSLLGDGGSSFVAGSAAQEPRR